MTAIKSDKVQVHNLMTQVKMMHEEDSKRFAEDLARVNRDCDRKVPPPPPKTHTSSLFLTPPTRVVYPCNAVRIFGRKNVARCCLESWFQDNTPKKIAELYDDGLITIHSLPNMPPHQR